MAYSLTYEYVPDSSPYYKVTGYSNIATTDNVIIPDTYNDNIHGSYPVTHIKYNAFKECSDLTHITIGSNITYIDDYAFAWCDKLASITIPNGVTSVGSSVFYNCSSLTDVVFESNSQLAVISANMFQSCTSLKRLTVPSSVTSIETAAFYDCSSLTNIFIPSSVAEIGEQVFYNCNSLINITVDESNSSYKSVDGSLYTKDGTMLIQYAVGQPVTTFSIPDGVTTIYSNAFLNCTSLVNVTIPDSVTDIYGGAFRNCTNLIQLILFPSTPPDLGSNAIPSNVQSIYVQQSSEAAYKVALDWAAFATKIVSDNIYLSFVRFNQKNKEYIDKEINDNWNDFNLENGTDAVLIQTTDSNHSFKVMKDGRAKVKSAPVDDDDVVRKIELDKPYELIEEITLTEETTVIDRTFNNFLTKLIVKVETPAQTSASDAYINVNIKGTIISSIKVATILYYIKTTKTYSFVDVSINNDMIKNYSSSGIENQSTNSALTCLSGSYGKMGFGDIKGIIFNASSANNIPTGTVIKIYGVRAK